MKLKNADIETRSSLEQLSGRRLAGFVCVSLVQLVSLVALGSLTLHLDSRQLLFCLMILAAMVSLSTLTVCNLSISTPVKLGTLVIFMSWCMWILRWISSPSDLAVVASISASTIILQAILIFSGITLFQVLTGSRHDAFRFGTTDLLFFLMSVALAVPILGHVFSSWPVEWLIQPTNAKNTLSGAVVNVCWCLALVFFYLPADRIRKNILIAVAFVTIAVSIEYWMRPLAEFSDNQAEMIFARLVYVGWMAVSMMPIFKSQVFKSPSQVFKSP